MDRRTFLASGILGAAGVALAPTPASAATADAGWFDVHEQGALGDGVADDTMAIQAAIDAAQLATGGVVWFPAGTYITSTLTLPGAVTLEGTGWQSTLKLKAGSTGPVITTPVGRTNYYGAIRSLCVNGNRENVTAATAHGIRLWAADHYRIEGVRVTNCRGSAIKGEGDSTHYTIAPYIEDCYLDSCTGSGLDINSYTYDVKADHVDIGLCNKGVIIANSSFIHDVSVWQCNTGFYGYWAARAHLVNCRAERCKNHGFWIDGCSDMMIEACRAYENNQANSAYDGFRLTGSSGHVTQRVSLVGCHSGLTGSSYEKQKYGFWDGDSQYVDYVLCEGCVAMGNVTAGLSLGAGSHNVVANNM